MAAIEKSDKASVLIEAFELMEKTESENPVPSAFIPSPASAWRGVAYKLFDLLKIDTSPGVKFDFEKTGVHACVKCHKSLALCECRP